MLKRINNTIFMSDGEYQCTWRKDCTAHDAAQKALDTAQEEYDAAQEAYDNAQALRDELKQEKENVQQMYNNYTKVYDSLMACDSGIANPNNMGDNGLGGTIDCLSKYGQNVDSAYQQAQNEADRCRDVRNLKARQLRAARETLANTPCVDVCD